MPQLTRISKISLVTAGILVIFAACLYALFHGYFDHGQFRTQQVVSSPGKELAVIGERFDQEALSSDQYFVLLSDHIPSAKELRAAYYSDQVIFRAGGSCLNVRWESSQHLIIECPDESITSGEIAVEKERFDGVKISYLRIPGRQ